MNNKCIATEDVLLSLSRPIAVVGNGHPGRNMGKVIDRFSSVIRINNYKVIGFEEIVGHKTTLRCTSGWEDIDVSCSLTEISPFRSDSSESACIEKYVARGGKSIITAEKDIHALLPEVPNPSTGLALAALASDMGIETVLFGFDSFSSGHYWEPGAPLVTTHSNIEKEYILKLPHIILYGISYDYTKLYDYCHTTHFDYNERLRLYKKMKLTPFGERILEFGAGNGQLAAYMENQGNLVTAIEVSQVAFERIPVVNKINGDCLALAQLDGHYDRFVSIDVLEHLTENDIRIVVREAARLARHIIVSVSTRPSGLLGPQGENLHITVRAVEWWQELFSKYFEVEMLPSENVGQITMTGTIHHSTHAIIDESPLPEDSFELPKNYCSREKPEYFTDSDEARGGVIWQPDVYPRAVELARELGCITLIDFGCGHAEKLISYYPEFNLIGIDYGANIDWCRNKYTFGTWLESDFEHIRVLPIPNDILKQSVIICSDVIEHLCNPCALFKLLHTLMNVVPALIFSTPDRILTWGENHTGPPPNTAHTREWSLVELKRLLEREGFSLASISHTRSNNVKNELNTILVQVVNHKESFHTSEQWANKGRSELCHSKLAQTKDLVSVIIPCYQQDRFLSEAVLSLQAQIHTNWEAIIVNDGSMDETESIARALCANDSRVRYIFKPNGGLSSARNAGMNQATGQWIQFLDADDLIHPDKISRQVELMRDMGPLAVTFTDYFPCDVNDLNRLVPERYTSPMLLSDSPLEEIAQHWETRLSIPVHCFLFDASIFRNYDVKFDENLSNHEDWDCWMQVFALKPTVKFINEKMAIYRIRNNGMCYDFQKMRFGFLQAIRKQKKLLDNNVTVKKMLDEKEKEIRYLYREFGLWGRLFKYIPNQVRSLVAWFIPWKIQRMFD